MAKLLFCPLPPRALSADVHVDSDGSQVSAGAPISVTP